MNNNLKDIFDKNYNALCNYANAIIHDKHTSEDLVQTVFIQLWESDKILKLENPESYLLKCVRYKCIDHLKKPSRHKEVHFEALPEISIKEETHITEEEILPMLHFFAAQLPPKMQKVFLMSRIQGMSYKEIAESLQVSTKTVENQMGSALKKMRVLLKKSQYLSIILMGLH